MADRIVIVSFNYDTAHYFGTLLCITFSYSKRIYFDPVVCIQRATLHKHTHTYTHRYNSDSDELWKGALFLQGYSVVRLNNTREFRLESKNQLGRSLDLKARDSQEASTWVQHLRDVHYLK